MSGPQASLMPKAIWSIKSPNTITMMPEVTEMVACPIFVSHMPDGNSYRLIQLLSKLYPSIC